MREADFMGALIASVSHELLNVLATIHQSSGLMDDLMGAGVRKGLLGIGVKTEFVHQEKFKAILGNINQQVQRGMALTEALNALGHAPEKDAQACDLWAAADVTLQLSERVARKRKVKFRLGRRQAPVQAGLEPLWAMMAIYEAMKAVLAEVKDCEVEILAEPSPEGAMVRFKTVSADQSGSAGEPKRESSAREIGICGQTVRIEPEANGFTLVFPPAGGGA